MSRELDIQCAMVLWTVEVVPPFYHQPAEPLFRTATEAYKPAPPFSSDHAAARLLEDEIERRGLSDAYVNALCGVCGVEGYDGLWALIRATPEQRARAFLAATGG